MAKKILIVDDEADLVDTLSARLEHMGYEVDEALSGKEGLGAYIAAMSIGEPIDLIILDIRMPGLSGLEVLDTIRKEEEIRSIKRDDRVPILMLTADKSPRYEAFDRGADDYFIKPIDWDALLTKIKEKLD